MKAILCSVFFLAPFLSEARITDGQTQFKITNNKIEVGVKAGFHFNIEAPAQAQFDDLKALFKPDPKTEKILVFTAPEKSKAAKLSFYVCDDAKTVCEQQKDQITLAKSEVASQGTADNHPVSQAIKKGTQSSNKPTLMMFSAPWCPACIRMQTETYNQKSVQNELKKITLKKINIDLPENLELSEKFHVKAIPTAILLNKDGEEVQRWLDYQPAKNFSEQIHVNLKKTLSIQSLEKDANAGNEEAASQLGMLAYSSMNCEQAFKWFSKSKKPTDQNFKLASEVMCAEEKAQLPKADQKDYLVTLESSAAKTFSKVDSLRWSVDLLEKRSEQKSQTTDFDAQVAKAAKGIDELLVDLNKTKKLFAESTSGEMGGFEMEELLLMKSRLFAAKEDQKSKIKVNEEIKKIIMSKKLSVKKPGEMLLAVAYLKEIQEKDSAEKFYQLLISEYPNTYVYHDKYARFLLKQKKLPLALMESSQALLFPEGNQPDLLLVKAKILKEMNNKKEALETVDAVLSLENISHRKYKKYLAQAETLKIELTTGHAQD